MHANLSTHFAHNSHVIRSNSPLTDEQIRFVAPSVYASEQHSSRSDRYSYIPTNVILDGLREQGFQPFMACQTRTRNVDNHEFTKHMLRLRHASQICSSEANEIILCPASTILSGRRQLPWPVLVEKWVSFLSSVFFDNYLLLFQ
jgi:hypothetical protein